MVQKLVGVRTPHAVQDLGFHDQGLTEHWRGSDGRRRLAAANQIQACAGKRTYCSVHYTVDLVTESDLILSLY